MRVWVGFDDYGVAGEGPIFRGVFATQEIAEAVMEAGCYGHRHLRAGDTHVCEPGRQHPPRDHWHHNRFERCWWYLDEETVAGSEDEDEQQDDEQHRHDAAADIHAVTVPR